MKKLSLNIDDETFEPIAQMLSANVMAQSLSYCLERSYLNNTDTLQNLKAIPYGTNLPSPIWLKINQVGKPLDGNMQYCMNALQNILHSLHLPSKSQLLFLINGNGNSFEIYLGIRSMNSNFNESSFLNNVKTFACSNWAGLDCTILKQDKGLSKFQDKFDYKNSFGINKLNTVALTGLPSQKKGLGNTLYPISIGNLLIGSESKDFSFLVVADPIPEFELNNIIYSCREISGHAEAFKSFNFTQNAQTSFSDAYSRAKNEFENWNNSEGKTKKNLGGFTSKALIGIGATLTTAFLFPPAAPFIASAAEGLVAAAGMSSALLISGLLPSTTNTTSKGGGSGTTETVSKTISNSNSKAISRTFVNKHVEAIINNLNHHIDRFETSKALGSWNVGAYLISDDSLNIQNEAMHLRSMLSGDDSFFEPIRIHSINDALKEGTQKSLKYFASPKIMVTEPNSEVIMEHPLGSLFSELKTPMNTKELSLLVNFPTKPVAGINVVETSTEFSLKETKTEKDNIALGKLLNAGTKTNLTYSIPSKELAKHSLVVGINGSGKSNTCRRIIQELLEDRNNTPFLIIEPAKDEYVEWAMKFNEENSNNAINIFMPGRNKWRNKSLNKFSINPFDVIWLDKNEKPNVFEHIQKLTGIFNAILPMQEVLPVLMEEAIFAAYSEIVKSDDDFNYQWITSSEKSRIPDFGTNFPNFETLKKWASQVLQQKGYARETHMSLNAAMETRINSFLRGWRKECFCPTNSSIAFYKRIFEKPTVINLSAIGNDDDKAFFMSVLFLMMYEYRQATHEIRNESHLNTPELKHLLLLEEAHRIIPNTQNNSASNSKVKVSEMFSNIIAEIRSYGQGVLIADQIPSKINPDALKNTNMKIAHRLPAADDKASISVSMDLNKNQSSLIGKLAPGQAIIKSNMDSMPSWVQIEQSKWDN